MDKQSIILIGGGGHCISCIDVIEQTGLFLIVGILDLPEKVGENVLDYPIIGTDDQISDYATHNKHFLITIGQIKSSAPRENIYRKVKNAGGDLPVIISPKAYVSKYAHIAEGSIVMHHAIVNANARIGKCAIINSKALVEHETVIGDFCHISTSSNINGQVQVGNHCFIGSNTVIANNLSITNNSIIAAGSQVLKNIDLPGIYFGNSLRKNR